jgi:hypothetical protein
MLVDDIIPVVILIIDVAATSPVTRSMEPLIDQSRLELPNKICTSSNLGNCQPQVGTRICEAVDGPGREVDNDAHGDRLWLRVFRFGCRRACTR